LALWRGGKKGEKSTSAPKMGKEKITHKKQQRRGVEEVKRNPPDWKKNHRNARNVQQTKESKLRPVK